MSMTQHVTDDTATGDPSRLRRYILAAGGFLAAILGGAIVFLWAWNTIAVDLFDAPSVGFSHAFAIEIAGLALFALAGFVLQIGRRAVPDRAVR